MKKLYSYIKRIGMFTLFAMGTASGVCPVCTFAVGAGVGLTRYLGIDDTISGIWLGALIVSLTMWTINWLDKKEIRFTGRKILVTLIYAVLVIVPLYYAGFLSTHANLLWGINKLVLGMVVGAVAFALSVWGYYELKQRNNNTPAFIFQKVVMPIGVLILISIIFYCITK